MYKELPKEPVVDILYRSTLIDLVRQSSAKRVAEVGVYAGFTAQAVLDACGDQISEYYLVDAWRLFKACELSPPIGVQRQWQANFDGVAVECCQRMLPYSAARIIRLWSVEAATLFELETLDLVFIDGDHTFGAVTSDIKAWLPTVRRGGLITGHDYGIVCEDANVKGAVDAFFAADEIQILPGSVWVVKKK